MGAQLLSSEKKGKEPCSQFTQTFSLFVTFVADLVHSLRRRIVEMCMSPLYGVFEGLRKMQNAWIFNHAV